MKKAPLTAPWERSEALCVRGEDQTKTSWTSSIYAAVPARMDSSVLRFHRWSPAVTATAMTSVTSELQDMKIKITLKCFSTVSEITAAALQKSI